MSQKLDLNLKVLNKVSLFQNDEEALLCVNGLINKSNPSVLSFINAHAYNLCHKEKDFANALLESDLVLRDGYGMEMFYKMIQKSPGANLNGTDFIPSLLDTFKGKRIALLGTRDPYLKNATDMLLAKGHQVVLVKDGFLPIEEYLPLVKNAAPDLVIIGMGMPKQEKLSILLKANLSHNCIIINGGAILDFWGNKYRRAPIWMRNLNIEWVFRLMIEPKRMYRRYIIGNYLFLRRVMEAKRQLKEVVPS